MTNETEKRLRGKRRFALVGISIVFVLGAITYLLLYVFVLSQREETDNAYVGGNMVTLTSQVTGSVQQIRADDTQMVQAGAAVVLLDPTDAQLALRQAAARLGNVVRQLRERYASVDQYAALVKERRLAVARAADDLARRLPLAADHTIAAEDVDHARQALAQARAAVAVALRQEDAARADTAGVPLARNPAVLAARADFEQAWLAARRDAILAPVSGYVAKRSVQVGAHVTPGMSLMSIVPLDQLWVDANFKESELKNIRIGQPATVTADLYGGKVTYHGKVVGLSAGTGSAFSLLPAQNANGNWIKVVQRLPVRIALRPDELKAHPLRIGLSTEVKVDTHDRSGTVLGMAMPAQPVYSTQALQQPMQEADAMADRIVAQNLVGRNPG